MTAPRRPSGCRGEQIIAVADNIFAVTERINYSVGPRRALRPHALNSTRYKAALALCDRFSPISQSLKSKRHIGSTTPHRSVCQWDLDPSTNNEGFALAIYIVRYKPNVTCSCKKGSQTLKDSTQNAPLTILKSII